MAGYGTRRLPVTKVVEKCMLPVLNRPVVDYIVQDCIEAGIEHIIFVVSEGSTQVQQYYSHDAKLEAYLEKNGKTDFIKLITPPANVKFEYVVQPRDAHYGTTTPVALARDLVPTGESSLVLMGDDVMYAGRDGTNPVKQLMDESDGHASMLVAEVPPEETFRYGVLALDDDGFLAHMVEKPKLGEAPSNLINISKYIFTSELLDETVTFYEEDYPEGQEKYVNIEPFDRYRVKGSKIKVIQNRGTYLDVGTLENWLRANEHVAFETGVL